MAPEFIEIKETPIHKRGDDEYKVVGNNENETNTLLVVLAKANGEKVNTVTKEIIIKCS